MGAIALRVRVAAAAIVVAVGCIGAWGVGTFASGAGNCGVGFTDNGGVCAVQLVPTGAVVTVAVPSGVSAMQMTVTGGQGGMSLDQGAGSGAPGGKGGLESATVPVVGGDTLSIVVGQAAGVADLITPPGAPFGGGGAPGSGYAGYGGGGSFVFSGSAGLLIAAGGGGGSGYDYNPDATGGRIAVQQAPGGDGAGATQAANGQAVAFCCDPTFNGPTHYAPGPGQGASPTGPGAGGTQTASMNWAGASPGTDGTGPAVDANNLGVGGTSTQSGVYPYTAWGGGGGGGYYGGGGGGSISFDLEGGGGGGGAGYVTPAATNASSQVGAQANDGQVTISYNPSTGGGGGGGGGGLGGAGFASGNLAPFALNQAGSFDINVDSTTTPTLALMGTLPDGLSFTDNNDGTATISGTPTRAGTKIVSVDAHTFAGDSYQRLAVVVGKAPKFPAAASATFVAAVPKTLVIKAPGVGPTDFASTGTLPAGLTFTTLPNGTASLAGTPDDHAVGSYSLTITANNLFGSATQILAVTVKAGKPGAPQALAATSPAAATVTATWVPPAATGGNPIISYTVQLKNGSAVVRSASVLAPLTTTTLGGLPTGITYTVSVSAKTLSGTGPPASTTLPL